MLWTSTHLALKTICSRNAAKIFSDIKNFPADMFLFGVRKNICTAPFLGTQELHSWSTLKANVCIFMYPSKHLLVLKTSSTRLQRNNFTSSKTSCKDVLKTSCKTKNYYAEDILKTSWRHVSKTSWRPLKNFMETNKILGISVYLSRDLPNLKVYLTSLYFTNLYLTTLKRSQKALIRTHHFNIRLILELKQHLYFKN